MLSAVEQMSVSPVFVGRGGELAALKAALRRAGEGQPQALLVGGEAGVGKTRLLEEFLTAAEAAGTVTMLGQCLEVGAEGLPYAPLVTALRRLHRRLGPELARAAEGMEGHLARVLPEFGETDAEPNDEYGRARLFEAITRLFERLSAEHTLVLAIEDLHWSDRSTRELLGYLISTLHRSRVLVCATYRTDDLHRRHPLRPYLAELERQRTVQRLELDRFGRHEVAAQLAGILRTETPDRLLVERIHRRSEGNPFFVEELVASHAGGCTVGLSDSLREILLVRVEALPESAQRVLRTAAEGGSRVEHQLLAAVLDGSEDELLDALRTAVGANILQPDRDGEGYRFRHALVREAVSDDLLPGERTRINRRFATALAADPGLVHGAERPARLANYWYHAHDPGRALASALDAARAARRRNAFAEQLRMLERALELWDEVDEETLATTLRPHDWAETYPPCSCDDAPRDRAGDCERLRLVDVLAEAVVAARRAGDRERGVSLAKRALKLVDETTDPLRAAWFRMNRARLLGHLNRRGYTEELGHALRLVEGRPPSAVQADVFSLAVGQAMLNSVIDTDLVLAERAVAIAREVGATSVELHAQMTLGTLYTELGDPDRGIATLREAIEGARRLSVPDLLTRGLNNLASLLGHLGRAEEGVQLAREGLAVAGDLGLLRNTGTILSGNLAECLLEVGRPDEAAEVLAGWEGDGRAEAHASYLHRLRGELALLRGDLVAVQEHLERAAAAAEQDQSQHEVPAARLLVDLAGRSGRPLQARAALLAALDATPWAGESRLLPLLARAAAVEADSRGLPSAEQDRPAVLARIAERLAAQRPVVPLHVGWARLAEAELARAEGADTPAHWQGAIEPLRATGLPYPLVHALLGGGGALAAAGQREQAGELLREAAGLAALRGDVWLGREIDRMLDRVGVARTRPHPSMGALVGARTEPSAPDGTAAFHLTPRETDVLRLLTEGRTNRQIAEELFISPKTASVHVSNILAKLEVSGRGEAAALAHRLRLFPITEPLQPVGPGA